MNEFTELHQSATANDEGRMSVQVPSIHQDEDTIPLFDKRPGIAQSSYPLY